MSDTLPLAYQTIYSQKMLNLLMVIYWSGSCCDGEREREMLESGWSPWKCFCISTDNHNSFREEGPAAQVGKTLEAAHRTLCTLYAPASSGTFQLIYLRFRGNTPYLKGKISGTKQLKELPGKQHSQSETEMGTSLGLEVQAGSHAWRHRCQSFPSPTSLGNDPLTDHSERLSSSSLAIPLVSSKSVDLPVGSPCFSGW